MTIGDVAGLVVVVSGLIAWVIYVVPRGRHWLLESFSGSVASFVFAATVALFEAGVVLQAVVEADQLRSKLAAASIGIVVTIAWATAAFFAARRASRLKSRAADDRGVGAA